jgi:hypothetical protein
LRSSCRELLRVYSVACFSEIKKRDGSTSQLSFFPSPNSLAISMCVGKHQRLDFGSSCLKIASSSSIT